MAAVVAATAPLTLVAFGLDEDDAADDDATEPAASAFTTRRTGSFSGVGDDEVEDGAASAHWPAPFESPPPFVLVNVTTVLPFVCMFVAS